jgi:hypothetical protein
MREQYRVLAEKYQLVIENNLEVWAKADQQERNAYQTFVNSKAGGDYKKGAQGYAQLKGRSADDVFGDDARIRSFMNTQFDFSKFTQKDWDNYWLLAQHSDKYIDFQKQALKNIQMYDPDKSHYEYLFDRIQKALTGKQTYNTQNV